MLKKPQSKLRIGDMLGDRYRISALLGEGGMGSVYLADDLKLPGKKWAVKESLRPPGDFQTCMDEAEMLIRLNHPYLPNIVDFFPPNRDGYSYLVVDYIKGQTLLDMFEKHNRNMPYRTVVKYAIQLCDLLHYLHHDAATPIIYRDLKPSNVMVDDQDHVRLIDFGIARHFKSGQSSDTVQIGTIGFAAPEQFEGRQTDHRTDLYNLGAMMYFLLSGGKYYYVAQKPLHLLRQDLPEQLARVVQKLLQANPEDRYANALDVKEQLAEVWPERLETEQAESAPPYRVVPPKLVVMASLYPGAGSTFVTIAIARALHACGIPHAVVEYPGTDPGLYHLLFGEKNAPPGYRFASDLLMQAGPAERAVEWTSGHTMWVPVNPDGHKVQWNKEHTMKLLFSMKKPVVLLDVSHRLDDAEVQELFAEADEICVVVDTFPARLNRRESLERLGKLYEYKQADKPIRLIANRDVSHPLRDDWLQSLPFPPLCTVPDIPYKEVIGSLWKGSLVHDQKEANRLLTEAVQPVVGHIVPGEALRPGSKTKRTGMLSRLFKGLPFS